MTAIAKLTLPHGHDAILKAAGINHITAQGVVTSPANWEANNIVRAAVPSPMKVEDTRELVSAIRIHKNLKESLQECLAQIKRNHPDSYDRLEFSGSFVPRPKRGQPNAFSMHSIGYAVDFNSSLYGFHPGKVWTLAEVVPWYRDVVNVFHAYGWKWGGDFGDVMHMQGGDGY